MPKDNKKYKDADSLMKGIIAKLSDYISGLFPSKKSEVAELIRAYEDGHISNLERLIGHLSLIFDSTSVFSLGRFSRLKKEITQMVSSYREQYLVTEAASSSSSATSSSSGVSSTSDDAAHDDISVLFNPVKNEVILELGVRMLEGRYELIYESQTPILMK